MNNVNTLIHNLTTSATVMAQLRDLLREVDPEYEKEAQAFDDACTTLIAGVKDITSIAPETYLTALEEEMASDILFVAGQGFKLCYDIHTNPINALAFQMDYEDLHQERKMYLMPLARKALNTSHAFLEELRASNRDKLGLLDGVNSYYSYLRTVGYKVAHYWGFLLADQLLPYLIPGYANDGTYATTYSLMLHKDIGVNIFKIK